MYRYISKTWEGHLQTRSPIIKDRAVIWRREQAILRIERPSRLDRARKLGFKSKQGFVMLRVRVGRGGMRKSRPKSGRRPKHLGTVRIKAAISMKQVAERRVLKKFPNLKVMGSYVVYRDGKNQWFEIILVDPDHPSIKVDSDLSWLSAKDAS
ncbi:MAG: 50S ribosomal protein L15e [Thaumarchaeota archaeon]|nr:50S ribosomal protein L15e [Nitrososphaerota archaeon]